MNAVVDRVRKLIALSASPNENEARNAAWLAVKAIREHKLDIVESRPMQRSAPPQRGPKKSGSETVVTVNGVRFDGVDFDFSDFFGVRTAQQHAQHAPRFVPTGPARKSRHHGTCARCQEKFKPGDHITAATDDTKGVVHADCATFWTVRA